MRFLKFIFWAIILQMAFFLVYAQDIPNLRLQIAHSCNIQQGFFYNSSSQVKFGYIEHMKIGDVELNGDFSVHGPDFEDLNVCGVMSHINWNEGIIDPIEISMQISTQNRI